uniref:Mitochondrial cytochrome c oxidase subunit VIc/VIIs domain-containing protein n=1 Tax=Parascaris univalens TaxID=6257 RepID=A0A915BSQ2_PARUN
RCCAQDFLCIRSCVCIVDIPIVAGVQPLVHYLQKNSFHLQQWLSSGRTGRIFRGSRLFGWTVFFWNTYGFVMWPPPLLSHARLPRRPRRPMHNVHFLLRPHFPSEQFDL